MSQEPERKIPTNIPSPIIYGPSYPDLKLFLKQGRQIVESRTNQNLRLKRGDFTESGTYTMGRFLHSHPLCSEGRTGPGCSGVVAKWWHMDDGSITKIELEDSIDIDACGFLSMLRGFCPASQWAFFEKYLEKNFQLYRDGFETAFEEYTNAHGPIRKWCATKLVESIVLGFPALIPEVWLAAIGADRTSDDEAYLAEHPQRVDFMMFAVGEKWVIEVDGPSHYAVYDEGQRHYLASEQIYTKNLRIERALRRQGWRLYRFSNLEIREADPDEFRRITSELPDDDDALFFMTKSDLEHVVPPSQFEDIPF